MAIRSFLEAFPVRATEGEVFRKYTKIWAKSQSGAIWPDPDFENVSDNVTSVLVDQTSSDATNDYQSLRNYPRSNYRANGSVWIDRDAPVFHQKTIKNSRKSENLDYRGQQKIQCTLGPSFALECKCAFGAIIFRCRFLSKMSKIGPKIWVTLSDFEWLLIDFLIKSFINEKWCEWLWVTLVIFGDDRFS